MGRRSLCACYSKLFGYAALRCARLIKPINGACFKLVGICSSMLSHLVPLSWTGVKYPTVREQARSSRVVKPFVDQIGIHRIAPRNLRYRNTCHPCLRTDQMFLVLRPKPFLLTLLARHRVPQNVHYQWWILSSHSQKRQMGRPDG